MQEHGARIAQQRLFRLAQALNAQNLDMAQRFVNDGAPVDEPLLFDEKDGAVPNARSVLPSCLVPEDDAVCPPPITLLGMAATTDDIDRIAWLLKQGSGPDMLMPKTGKDAAWLAMEHNALAAYTQLMSQGLSPSLRLSDGSRRTRLIAATLCRAQAVVHDLIQRKVDLNAYDAQGRTALHHNLVQDPYTDDDLSIARLLLDKGANPNIEDNNGIPAHALAKSEIQQALMTGFRLAQITDEARRKLNEKPVDPDALDPASDPGIPQVRRPRPARPRL